MLNGPCLSTVPSPLVRRIPCAFPFLFYFSSGLGIPASSFRFVLTIETLKHFPARSTKKCTKMKKNSVFIYIEKLGQRYCPKWLESLEMLKIMLTVTKAQHCSWNVLNMFSLCLMGHMIVSTGYNAQWYAEHSEPFRRLVRTIQRRVAIMPHVKHNRTYMSTMLS